MTAQARWSAAEYALMRRMLLPAMSELASTAPNARYTDADMLDMSLAMCTRNQFVAPTFRSLRKCGVETMTPQRFLQMFGRKTPDEMLEIGCDILEASVGAVVRSGRLRGPVTVAVDEHLIPYHGGESTYTKGGRKRGGTTRFEGYITAQAVSRRPSAAFAAYPIANGEAQSNYLGGLIENVRRAGTEIQAVLLDRGFNSVANILEMEAPGVRFVMPLSGSTRLYGIMAEVDAGTGPAVLPYTMTSRNGQSVTATLVIVPKARKRGRIRDRYVAFLTNIKLDCSKKLLRHIPKTYRVRWGIETRYRVLGGARARTKSPKMAARLFFFFLSLALYNFWSLCRQERAVWAGKAMPMSMYDYADTLWMYIAGEDRPP